MMVRRLVILWTVLAVTLIPQLSFAQTESQSISGRCGNLVEKRDANGRVTGYVKDRECNAYEFKAMISRLFAFVIQIAMWASVLSIMVGALYLGLTRDKPEARKIAKSRILRAIMMIVGFSLLFSGVYFTFLRLAGVNDSFLQIKSLFGSIQLVETAHAAGAEYLTEAKPPVYLTQTFAVNDWKKILLDFVYLMIRWLVIPCVLAAWVISGWLFVAAQGSPEKLKYAREWVLYTILMTAIVLLSFGLLRVADQTVGQINSSIR